jgi:hypothetical protein
MDANINHSPFLFPNKQLAALSHVPAWFRLLADRRTAQVMPFMPYRRVVLMMHSWLAAILTINNQINLTRREKKKFFFLKYIIIVGNTFQSYE